MIRHRTDRGVVHEARAEMVYPTLEPGSVQLVMCDGPYFLGMEEWDKGDLEDLPEWYRPHIKAWDRICAPSSSVCVWGTDASASALRPEMKAHDWTLQVRVTWEKYNAQTQKADPTMARKWPDVTEVFDLYQREGMEDPDCAGVQIQYAAGADERNWIRVWLGTEWAAAGLRRGQADKALGTNGMAGHYFGSSQWSLPTLENYRLMAAYAAEHGTPRERPYLVHSSVWPAPSADHLRATHDHLRAEYDHLRAEYDHLRAEYEAQRVPFNLPPGVTNVWRHPIVAGSERLRDRAGRPLHKCQKPLALVRRMILASTRPGGLVCAPFGGTLREALVCEQLSPSQARRYITSEVNKDKVNGKPVDYLGPAIEELEAARQQGHLF